MHPISDFVFFYVDACLLLPVGFVLWPILAGLGFETPFQWGKSLVEEVCRGAVWGSCAGSLVLFLASIRLGPSVGVFLIALALGPIVGGPFGASIVRIVVDRRRWAHAAQAPSPYAKRESPKPEPLQFRLSSLLVLMTALAGLCGMAATAPVLVYVPYGLVYGLGPCVIFVLARKWPRVPPNHRKTVGMVLIPVFLTPMIVVRALGYGPFHSVPTLLVGTSVWWGFQSAVLGMYYYALRPAAASYDLRCACGRGFQVVEADAELQVACPHCGAAIAVPSLAELEKAAARPPQPLQALCP